MNKLKKQYSEYLDTRQFDTQANGIIDTIPVSERSQETERVDSDYYFSNNVRGESG